MRKRLKKIPICDLFGGVIGYEAPEKEIKIVECDKSQADIIVCKYHYSHKATKNSFVSLVVYWRGKIHGALQCGYGIRPQIKGNYKPEQVREFDRMWLSDDMPKYSETIVLSLFHYYMKARHPEVKVLISYADTTAGNSGTIYKAANYRLIDRIRSDFYQLPSGERIHPVSMYHRHGTRAWDFLTRQYPGIVHIRDGWQLKFVMYL